MRKYKFNLILLPLILFLSCKKENCPTAATGINGTWIWVQTVGGFGGGTSTPASEKITRRLNIDDFVFREFVNDSLVQERQYELEIRQDSMMGTDKFIVFENGQEQAIIIGQNKLELFDLCADCFRYSYERE